eukprot:gnl/MRDRNA2_/MRDRNA2_90402_c0_seq1.p1 gnl/MRDRNA2_/MRDRNA2_90402_c0~~gnl/MRDRNA2_/MRDRNA2_90402_c0_seq1.p1  ORF type:complete len:373 (-),score=70.44 gnl/MRDRNA2_/MRDRNA2_90402_c0_seq1:31-1149(-)
MPISYCDACMLHHSSGHVLLDVDHPPLVRNVASRSTQTQQRASHNRTFGLDFNSEFMKRGGSGRKNLQNDLTTVSELYADAVGRSERQEEVWEQLESSVLGHGGLFKETEELAFERARCTNELCEEYARRDQEKTHVASLEVQLKHRESSVAELRLCLAVLQKQLASRAWACRAASKGLEEVERLSDRSWERAETELQALTQDLQGTQRQLRQCRERSLTLSQQLGAEEAACNEMAVDLSVLRGEAAERQTALQAQEEQLEAREIQHRQVQRKAQRLEAQIALDLDLKKSVIQSGMSPATTARSSGPCTPSKPRSSGSLQKHQYVLDVLHDRDHLQKCINDAEMRSLKCEAEMQALSESSPYLSRKAIKSPY